MNRSSILNPNTVASRDGVCLSHPQEEDPASTWESSEFLSTRQSAVLKHNSLFRLTVVNLTSCYSNGTGAAKLPDWNTAESEFCVMERQRNLQFQEGISMCGLYATSSSGVYKAGKRKGLLWKEVDDGTAKMLPHISSVFYVLYFSGQQYWPFCWQKENTYGAALQFLW